jgi:hypothetical protein
MRPGRWLFVLPIILIPSTASAHRHNMSFFPAYSKREGSGFIGGGELSYEYVLGKKPSIPDPCLKRPVSVLIDYSDHGSDDEKHRMGLLGARYSWGGSCHAPVDWSITIQGMGGGQRLLDQTFGVLGGGAGFELFPWKLFGIRVQGDVLFADTPAGMKRRLRWGIGFVIRTF